MLDTPTESHTILYIVNYLDWQREGQFTFDMQRAKLLDTLAFMMESLEEENEAPRHIVLGGETIVPSDIASISDDLMAFLLKYMQNGVLSLGPWYIQPDGLLSDGESFIRNLLIGRADSKRYGISPSTIAFMPDHSHSVARLPQILKGFGINVAFMSTRNPVIPMPYNWQSPDGSGILMINYQIQDKPEQSIEKQSQGQPDGPFLWLHRTDSPDTFPAIELNDSLAFKALYSNPVDFTKIVRDYLPDEFRPVLKGELHLHDINETSGRFSSRISYKQDVMRLRTKLNYLAEPLLALSLVFGTPRFPEIQKSLINYSWRLLLQNTSTLTFAGAVNDDVYNEMLIRNRQIEDNSQRVIEKALEGLDGTPYTGKQPPEQTAETYFVVWNLHGHPVEQVVELIVDLPSGTNPAVLLDPDGEEQPFTWDDENKSIDFRASVPAVGYAVYTLKIGQDETAAYNQRRAVAGRSIGSASGESLGLVGGRLDWVFSGGNIIDLLNYYDGGDAGDVWQYQEPEPDVLMRGSIVDVVQVEATPTYERLRFRNRMRIAPGLKDGTARTRGLRVLELETTATYYNNSPGVHFTTKFTNPASDHRLRVHLRTGINGNRVYTDSAFGLSEYTLGEMGTGGDLPVQSLVSLSDNKRGFGLFTRGLPAVEVIQEDKQMTLALTLLRSVGWLNKAQKVKAPGAQVSGDIQAEFMLMPLDATLDSENLLRTGLSYKAPLRAFQYRNKPETMRRGYLRLEGVGVIMSTLKTRQKGAGLVIRLMNITENENPVRVLSESKLSNAVRMNFAEEKLSDVTVENNQINLTLAPHEIVTIHLVF